MDKFVKDTNIMEGKGEWDETKHPRDEDGKFASKGEGQSTTSQKNKEKTTNTGGFDKQVDNVLDRNFNGDGQLKVSNKTPKILQDIGIPNKPIIISQAVVKKIAETHELTREQIKNLPQKMGEPFLVMKSFTRKNSVVEYIRDVDKQGRPIMVSIIINKSGKINDVYIRANSISSAYGRNNFENHVKLGIESNSILYYNEKRLRHLPVNEGLQLPNIVKDLKPYNNIIQQIK